MGTWYNAETGQYQNYENEVVKRLKSIASKPALPATTAADAGKALLVNEEGQWAAGVISAYGGITVSGTTLVFSGGESE